MKTKTIHLGLALLTCSIATAQEPDQPQGHRPPLPPPPFIAMFDKDRDGKISAEETQAAADVLAKLDRNNDGEITRDERRPPGPPPGEGQPPGEGPPCGEFRPVPPLVAALDTDKDGTISAEELEGAPDSLTALDANQDGQLTPEEIHPHGPPHRRPQGPPLGDDIPGYE
jgi:hypothetical protein